jgi:hypothetical protein
MNDIVCNNYSHSYASELHLELAIYNNFLGLNDLINVSKINKTFNSIVKKYINEYYSILQKCYKIEMKNSYTHLYGGSRGIDYTYDRNYWYNYFGRKLNSQELALYYAYFVEKYHYSCKIEEYKHVWICVIYPDGFIKLLASKIDGSISTMYGNNDIILRITRFYNYTIKRIYLTTEIMYEPETNINYSHVDEELLSKLLIKNNLDYIINNAILYRFLFTDKFNLHRSIHYIQN